MLIVNLDAKWRWVPEIRRHCQESEGVCFRAWDIFWLGVQICIYNRAAGRVAVDRMNSK